jgi:hypothetical protein
MARLAIFSALALLFTAASAQTERNCPAERPVGLCCDSLQPFSANAYVWENICGYAPPSDTTTPTASRCSGPGTWCVVLFVYHLMSEAEA